MKTAGVLVVALASAAALPAAPPAPAPEIRLVPLVAIDQIPVGFSGRVLTEALRALTVEVPRRTAR